jgi:adenylate kinase family enzyme
MRTYLIHGPAGCGKDTQVDLIIDKFPSFQKIGTGEMFRSMLTNNMPFHPEAYDAHTYWSVGKPVPSVLTYSMLEYWLRHKFDPSKDWFFVSTVRSFDQVKLLDDLLGIFGRKLDKFIHLKLNSGDVVARLSVRTYCMKCQTTYSPNSKQEVNKGFCDNDGQKLVTREDDLPAAIERRLKTQYLDTIADIENEYQNRGILVEVDATPDIETIRKDLWEKLGLA